MKQYLLSVHYVEGQPPPLSKTITQMYKDVEALNQELKTGKAWVFGGGLLEPHLATVVRQEGGEILTTDGPFAHLAANGAP